MSRVGSYRHRLDGSRRETFEQAVARGVPNHRLMAEYRITYKQLRFYVDAMVYEPPKRAKSPTPRRSHGTEAGWSTHRRKKEAPCGPCRVAHEARFAAEKESRRKANAERRYKGVA